MKNNISIGRTLVGAIVVIIALACVFPVYLVVITSFSAETAITTSGFKFIPEEFSLTAYKTLFSKGSPVFTGYKNSIIITLFGTLAAVTITTMVAYCLANKKVRYRKQLALYFFFTMLFTGGMVPWYLMNKTLGLYDNIWALLIPGMIFNPFNMYLVRNFIQGLPDAMAESARIDGANDITIAFRIVVPLILPVLATITLFYGVAYWNSWWNALMLIDNPDLYPLPYLLLQLRSRIEELRLSPAALGLQKLPAETLRMATTVITIGPIILLYPLLQRYFIKGIIIGAIKG